MVERRQSAEKRETGAMQVTGNHGSRKSDIGPIDKAWWWSCTLRRQPPTNAQLVMPTFARRGRAYSRWIVFIRPRSFSDSIT
jgi:hypothetical protein